MPQNFSDFIWLSILLPLLGFIGKVLWDYFQGIKKNASDAIKAVDAFKRGHDENDGKWMREWGEQLNKIENMESAIRTAQQSAETALQHSQEIKDNYVARFEDVNARIGQMEKSILQEMAKIGTSVAVLNAQLSQRKVEG